MHGWNDKRREELAVASVQEGNRRWWTENPMAYDWRGDIRGPRFSGSWFQELDARFLHGSRLFASNRLPFDRILPLERLAGARVLEVGCGMGLLSDTMARAGAEVTAIDLTPTAIEATAHRIRLSGSSVRLVRADAESLPFRDGSFDFVWSWGVIHHSSRTAAIVRQIARGLTSRGECRVMVYNREGMPARIAFVRDHLLKGGFLRRTFDETLYHGSDGFSARFYVREQLEDLFRAFFRDVSSQVCGQDADVVPLPRGIRRWVLPIVPVSYQRRAQARRGAFILVTARQPH